MASQRKIMIDEYYRHRTGNSGSFGKLFEARERALRHVLVSVLWVPLGLALAPDAIYLGVHQLILARDSRSMYTTGNVSESFMGSHEFTTCRSPICREPPPYIMGIKEERVDNVASVLALHESALSTLRSLCQSLDTMEERYHSDLRS